MLIDSKLTAMLILSPKIVIGDFLGIPFNRLAIKQLVSLTGKTERTIYNWFSSEKIPKRSDFLRVIEQIDKALDGNYVGVAYPINSYEMIRVFKNPDWSIFAATQLKQDENVFSGTFVEMLRRCRFHVTEFNDDSLYQLGSYLPQEMIDNVYSKFNDGSTPEMVQAFLELVALLYYLAFAEAEYLISINHGESLLCRKLPQYVDEKRKAVNTPVEIFFKEWFSKLIELEIYDSKKAIAEEIEDWCELGERLSATREINRMENDATYPSWKTLNEWVIGLLPPEFEGSAVDKKFELIHAQNVFGGTRILDKCLSEFLGLFPGKEDPVDFFQKLYPHFFKQHMTNIKKQTGSMARLS